MTEPALPRVPAIVAAGDRRASKAIYGESKVYLQLAGRPLVAHAVEVLQQVPEVSEVWVVGDAERLGAIFDTPEQQARLTKPLHVVGQFRNLYENAWETYRRLLPGAGPEGRDPGPEDLDQRALFLSADLPFATPQEISAFVREALALDITYVLGLATEEALQDFSPQAPGEPGIRVAYFNLREGRFRQTNLHLVKPARLGNRHYIEEMYEHRYQKQFGNILGLAWRLLRDERGGLSMIFYYALMHLAALADRRGLRRTADWIRARIPVPRIEAGCSTLLRASFRFLATEAGGCAIDIDNEEDYDAAVRMYEVWMRRQRERAERCYGPLPLTAGQPESAA